jgi:tetratricopeptide (TPR) repeat protein
MERIVCEREPSRPSDCVQRPDGDSESRARSRASTPRGLARILAGDLDRIVLKALRKEPRQRYASVAKLAEDLGCYLAGLPVSAQADTFAYRASKFVRRNRTSVSAAALVLTALVGGLVISLHQYRRADRARSAEQEQRELAEERLLVSERLAADLAAERTAATNRLAEVERLNLELESQRALAERRFDDVRGFATRLIFDLHGYLYPLEGTLQAQEFVVGTGVEYLDKLAAESAGDQQLQRELAHGYLRISTTQGDWGLSNLGRLEDAMATAAKAVAIGEALVEAHPEEMNNLFTLAQARCTRASLLRAAGREGQAMAELRSAVEISRPLELQSDPKYGHLYVAYVSRILLADILQTRLPAQEVAALFEECEALFPRLIQVYNSPVTTSELELVRVVASRLQYSRGEVEEAMARLTAALESLERIAASSPRDRNIARKVRVARATLAPMLAERGEHEQALALLASNQAAIDAAIAAEPLNVQARDDLVTNARLRMKVCSSAENWREAASIGEARLELARENLKRAPQNAEVRLSLAALLRELGACQRRLDLDLQAGECLAQARELLEALISNDPSLNSAHLELARVWIELGRAHRDEADSALGEPERRERSLASAFDCFQRALEEIRPFEEAGVAIDDPRPQATREELAECEEDLATLARSRD